MKQTVINLLVEEELANANQKFPAFASTHEGWAVLQEEVDELEHEQTMMKIGMNVLWGMIKENHPINEIIDYASELRGDAFKAIEEAIQVAAMCDKFQTLAPKLDLDEVTK